MTFPMDLAMRITNAAEHIATSIEGIAVALQGIDSAGVEHTHTWVHLREEKTVHPMSPAELREKVTGAEELIKWGTDRYYQMSDLYYCSGCPEMRRITTQHHIVTPEGMGIPHTLVFWRRDIPSE